MTVVNIFKDRLEHSTIKKALEEQRELLSGAIAVVDAIEDIIYILEMKDMEYHKDER